MDIKKLLTSDEDEYHDFKREWYKDYQKAEMIKDIFSFVNTVHDEDCYLVLGVDDNKKVVGVENDENRLNTENLTNQISNWPIANKSLPDIIVKTVNVQKHEIDLIIIKNTRDVPMYLDKKYQPNHKSKAINPGQIFYRNGRTNTPINETAKDYQVEELWKKRLGLNLDIDQQFKEKLKDVNNWKYSDELQRFLYKLNPDYCLNLVDDNTNRNKVESYSISQLRVRIYWKKLILKYKDKEIRSFLVTCLNDYRFAIVAPELSALDHHNLPGKMLTYQYVLSDSWDMLINKLFFYAPGSLLAPDELSRSNLFKNIVVYKNDEQRKNVEQKLQSDLDRIRSKIKPTPEQLNYVLNSIRLALRSDTYESNNDYVERICEEANLGIYINNYINNL